MSSIVSVVAAAALGAILAIGGSLIAVNSVAGSKPAPVDKPLIEYGVR